MPFFQTAVLGSAGAQELVDGDVIHHFNLVRFRVHGSGVLRTTLYSQDNVENQILNVINMVSLDSRFRDAKANFISPRCSVRVETTDIDEVFSIMKISIYHKVLWTEYPG